MSHSRSLDFENELYKPIRGSDLNNQYDFFLPHEHGRTINSRKDIEGSDLILAEVSYPSTGQGIELGWASGLDIPILCMSQTGKKITNALRSVTEDFIEYSNTSDFINKLSIYLSRQSRR